VDRDRGRRQRREEEEDKEADVEQKVRTPQSDAGKKKIVLQPFVWAGKKNMPKIALNHILMHHSSC
jgi:hypothetical protein